MGEYLKEITHGGADVVIDCRHRRQEVCSGVYRTEAITHRTPLEQASDAYRIFNDHEELH